MSAATAMIAQLTMEDFTACLHQAFQIRTGANVAPLAAELVEVTPLPDNEEGGTERQPFSIVLRSRDDRILPQRIYCVEHEGLGTLDIFLVPIGPDDAGMRYEALFS